ncbi:MAG: hypothetical protein ACOX6T_10500 [Myxococcales bacterium]|jgi:hypothetical protein
MKTRVIGVLALATAAALVSACSGILSSHNQPEQLFFAMRIEDEGQVLARPHLLGEAGHKLSMRLVDPNRPELTRLKLELLPERTGDGYQVQLGVATAKRPTPHVGMLSLLHGEERKLVLRGADGPLEVTLLVMRVDSPEFEAWKELVRREQLDRSS